MTYTNVLCGTTVPARRRRAAPGDRGPGLRGESGKMAYVIHADSASRTRCASPPWRSRRSRGRRSGGAGAAAPATGHAGERAPLVSAAARAVFQRAGLERRRRDRAAASSGHVDDDSLDGGPLGRTDPRRPDVGRVRRPCRPAATRSARSRRARTTRARLRRERLRLLDVVVGAGAALRGAARPPTRRARQLFAAAARPGGFGPSRDGAARRCARPARLGRRGRARRSAAARARLLAGRGARITTYSPSTRLQERLGSPSGTTRRGRCPTARRPTSRGGLGAGARGRRHGDARGGGLRPRVVRDLRGGGGADTGRDPPSPA